MSFKLYLSNLSAIDDTDYLLWKATRCMKRHYVHVPHIRKEDRTWACSEQDKVYSRHFERIFQPKDITF